MTEWIVAHEAAVRLACFTTALVLLLVAQALAPRRAQPQRRRLRWAANFGVVVVDVLVLRVLLPLGAVGAALWAESAEFGLLREAGLPRVWAAVLGFVALDLIIYWQHRLSHKVPLFWRLHRVHHSDVEFDTTTGFRFHPVEIVLSMLIKMGAVALLGIPAIGVIVFEIALNATSMFNHSNLRLSPGLDAALRPFFVTPDMHRVHHSTFRAEHDRNFGFNFSFWDRLFGSYTAQPREGHLAMRIGLDDFREPATQRLGPLLLQPMRPLAGPP